LYNYSISNFSKEGEKMKTLSLLVLASLVFPITTYAVVPTPEKMQQNGPNSVEEVDNQDEEVRVQIMNQAQEGAKETTKTREYLETLTPEEIQEKVGNARQNMGDVARKAQELAQNEERFGGIGEEIATLAKQQEEAQRRIEQNVEKIEARRGILKFFLGADRNALENIDTTIEENEERIATLQELEESVTDDEAREEVSDMIQSLRDQNVALQQKVEGETQSRGVFGLFTALTNIFRQE
jgi:chromosome segregation ATPase